ncbi:MAG: hypothetical protein K0R57_4080 [Paenibacillaceae bacterium]|nr:hypothetical protein [Paenibacillaceae bacterium]
MHNLLIVDDEPLVTNSLRVLFEEEMSSELEIFHAYNGQQTLRILQEQRVDIALLDINLPDINGIELHRRIIDNWKHCKVIFLTGEDDFTFIKAAIHHKALDYLLKDEGDDVIVAAVRNALELIVSDESHQELIRQAEEQVNHLLPLLRHDFFTSLLNGHLCSLEERLERFRRLSVELDARHSFIPLLAKLDQGEGEVEEWIIYKVRGVIASFLQDKFLQTSVVSPNNEVLFFLQPAREESLQQFHVRLAGMLDLAQAACRSGLAMTVSFAVMKTACPWSQTNQVLASLQRSLYAGYGYYREMMLEADWEEAAAETQTSDSGERGAELFHKLHRLEEKLLQRQPEQFTSLLAHLAAEADQLVPLGSATGEKGLAMLIQMTNRYCRDLGVETVPEQAEELELLGEGHSIASWKDAGMAASRQVAMASTMKLKKLHEDEKGVIKKLHQYIEDNLEGDVSLSRLAQIVHFNPYYLSRLYQQMTGQGLSDYIRSVRINRAKSMLENKDNPIKEIVEKLGFSDNAYFTRFFKKNTGMTPREYRERDR